MLRIQMTFNCKKTKIWKLPVPVAAWFNAWVCVLSPAGVVGSDPAGGMDISLL